MCELLGMNCNVPTDIRFSFRGFSRRGGETGPHDDGWGIAFYGQRGCRLFHDPDASARSPVAQLLREHPIKSLNVVAHIRRARSGRVCVENTHPFHRELWGRQWVFAHNGLLRGVKKRPLGVYRPVGTTDSEHAFCVLLDAVRREFSGLPPLPRLRRFVMTVAADLAKHGELNFLLCDSRALLAHCTSRLVYLERQAPFRRAVLADEDFAVDFSAEAAARDRVAVVATAPLTRNEDWTVIPPGTLAMFVAGGHVPAA